MPPEMWGLFIAIVSALASGGVVTGVMRERNRRAAIEHAAEHQDRVDVATEWARIDARNQAQWDIANNALKACQENESVMRERVAVSEDRAAQAIVQCHAEKSRGDRLEVALDRMAAELRSLKSAMSEAIEGNPPRRTWPRAET